MTTPDRSPYRDVPDASEADLAEQQRAVSDVDEDSWQDAQRVSLDRDWQANEADLVEQAVNDGDTVVIAPGGERLAWSDTIVLGEAGTTTAATVPGLPPMPTGAGPGGIYDPGQPGGYGTSAGGY